MHVGDGLCFGSKPAVLDKFHIANHDYSWWFNTRKWNIYVVLWAVELKSKNKIVSSASSRIISQWSNDNLHQTVPETVLP